MIINKNRVFIFFVPTITFIISCFIFFLSCNVEPPREINENKQFDAKTYCNPIDIDYTYTVVNTHRGISYRSGADPAVVKHNNEFYMFVTRSQGYWHSEDMCNWDFISPVRWYFESSNAPGAWSADSAILLLGNPSGWMSLIYASDPYIGNWKAQPSLIPININDPALFIDDDGKVYLYEESSNKLPIVGVELDPQNFYLPKGDPVELLSLQPKTHGWERFGEDHLSDRKPYLEGAWMTKYNGKYYLQYAAPGTQWNVYSDGVYVGDHPLGPFEYAPYNPVSYKPGGFFTGAGHGSTVRDNHGNYWHFATGRISVNYTMERRISMFPAGFEKDGQMFVNTAYGDYPHYLPGISVKLHNDRFTGWMLLSYKKPVIASSVKKNEEMRRIDDSPGGWMLPLDNMNYNPGNVTDENIQTFWLAQSNTNKEWLEIDLQQKDTVYALQINYQDFNSDVFGKPKNKLFHQFIIECSPDHENWEVIADFSKSKKDKPNAYIELESSIIAQYIRFKNIHVPVPNLAISGFRVFGKGSGNPPDTPTNLKVIRNIDRRNVKITWSSVEKAQGYTLYWGIDKGKLNNSAMIYDHNFYELRALTVDQEYFFAIEAFNENGISSRLIPNKATFDLKQ